QVRLLPEASFSSSGALFPWQGAASCATPKVFQLAERDYAERVGSLRQTTVWRSAASPQVPGPLHSSRGHLQPAPGCPSERLSDFSLEGLRARKPARDHDTAGDRIH